MFFHVENELYLLLTGALSPEERARVEPHLASCAHCQRELTRLREALGWLPYALTPRAVEAPARARLFASIDKLERFASFAPRVADLLDTDSNTARRLLHALDTSESWPQGPLHAMRFFRLEHALGPRREGVVAAFSRFEPGFRFPLHRHEGEEDILLFEGELTDGQHTAHAGDLVHSADASCHEIEVPASSTVPCLCLIVNFGGLALA